MPEDSKVPMMSFYMSRQRLDINNLKPENVKIEDIAHDLAFLPRFSGGTVRPYSVGEHSIMVMQMVEAQRADPKIVLQALMHDAAEYIIGDIPAPVKCAVPEIRDFEQRVIWPVICEALDIEQEIDPIVKKADWVALYVEAYSLNCSDELQNWEQYEKHWPMAEQWMEAYGEIPREQMPHPDVIQDVFLNCYGSLKAAIEEAEAA